MRRVLVHALGGGAGHVVRGASLAAAFDRLGVPAVALVPSVRLPLAKHLCKSPIGFHRPRSRAELERALRALVERLEITDLVADTFPEGILGELAAMPRDLCSAAVVRQRRDGRSSAFLGALERFACRIDIEPELDWLPPDRALACPPVSRALERRPSDLDVLVAAGSGECSGLYAKLSRRLASAGLCVDVRTDRDGLLGERELSARVVVGGAGYNLTHELARLGTWHIAIPLSRRFDDQRARAERWAIVCSGPESLERRVLALVRGAEPRRREPVQTHAALARLILAAPASVDHVQ